MEETIRELKKQLDRQKKELTKKDTELRYDKQEMQENTLKFLISSLLRRNGKRRFQRLTNRSKHLTKQ